MKTNAEQRKVNERIATAMGWIHQRDELYGEGWSPGRNRCESDGTGVRIPWQSHPPDFFADPAAATALWEWLFAKGFETLISPEKGIAKATRWEAEITREGLVPGVVSTGPNWMACLASAMEERVLAAANTAIREAK